MTIYYKQEGNKHLVSGEWSDLDKVRGKLSNYGFAWGTISKAFFLKDSDFQALSSARQKNCKKLLSSFEAGRHQTAQDKVLAELADRKRTPILGSSCPYDDTLNALAKEAGAIWCPTTKMWWFETREASLAFREKRDQHPKVAIPKEIRRRSEAGLALSIPFEWKDRAKELGGLWAPEGRRWCMPDAESAKQLLAEIRAEKAAQVATTPAPEAPAAGVKVTPSPKSGPLATEKQKGIIRHARCRWFDLFDGASGYDALNGPTEAELAEMTSEDASWLIGIIFSGGV